MDFTRVQVTAALTTLGLDPDLTTSVVISPANIYAEVAVLQDGHPTVEHGALDTTTINAPILEEAPNGDS